MSTNSDPPGPTGQFPRGKISDADEGEINIVVGVHETGTVVLDFGIPVRWVAMSPTDARNFAALVVNAARSSGKI